jgi:phosphatidylglycerophosphatase C
VTKPGSPLALFDFDGTLTHGDSLLPFLRYALFPGELLLGALRSLPRLAMLAVGVIDNETAKQDLFAHTLGGKALADLQALGTRFAAEVVPRLLREDTFARFQEHRDQGHTCILVSASLDLYLHPWSNAAGFNYCVCSSLEASADDRVSGRLAGGNCYGEEKVARIRALIHSLDPPAEIHAYGDSRGDRPMLAMADHAWWVTRDGLRGA